LRDAKQRFSPRIDDTQPQVSTCFIAGSIFVALSGFATILPRLTYLWVIFGVLVLNFIFIKRRLKKAVELSAGCIKGVLLLFGELRPDERASLFFEKIEGHCLDRFATKGRVIIKAAYYLAAKHPHMVAMTA
jgi:hypothetical protein